MSLLSYEHEFSNLQMNTNGGNGKSPHKVAMLLAVIELIETGQIEDNRIPFDQRLSETFTEHFHRLAGPNDRNNPHLPFFHLRSIGFWRHYLKPGMQESYQQLSTVSGPIIIAKHISFVHLDDELFELLGNGVARELLKAALSRNLTSQDRDALLDVGTSWDWLECEATVKDYFEMLNKELAGVKYNKSAHRRGLSPKLKSRGSAIEFKHQNISAILIEQGMPYISGYKPRFNYQLQLKDVVLAYVAGNPIDFEYLTAAGSAVVEKPFAQPDWAKVFDTECPERITTIQEPKRRYLASKLNYTERERNNRELGERGEAFVIEYERYRLTLAGRADLAREVEWSSSEQGDGLGYDVRSFNAVRDEELFIEVKTTNSGKYQPFFISENEVAFSRISACQYSLYRVYDFKQQARLFQLNGAVDQHVNLEPQSYKAKF